MEGFEELMDTKWRREKAKAHGLDDSSIASIMHILNSKSSSKTKSRTKTKKKSAQSSEKKSRSSGTKKTQEHDEGEKKVPSQDIVPVQKSISYPSAEEFIKAIQRDINGLVDERAGVRKKACIAVEGALRSLEPRFFKEHADEIFDPIMKPVLKRLSDSVERCREQGVKLLRLFVPYLLDMGTVLPYLIPAVLERVIPPESFHDDATNMFIVDKELYEAHRRGRAVDLENPFSAKVIEPSEEVRLEIGLLLDELLERAEALETVAICVPYISELALAAHSFVSDPFPDLKIVGCGFVQRLCRVWSAAVKAYAPAFVRSIRWCLDHRHAKVRIAGLQALYDAVACPDEAKRRGAGSEALPDVMGHREENVIPVSAFYKGETRINHFAKLIIDNNPKVRLAFVECISRWTLNLLNRYDHESRLLPYLLSGLGDPHPSIATFCRDAIEKLGVVYEKENEKEILEKKQYGVDGDVRIDYSQPLPFPFPTRPRLGARMYVRGQIKRFLKPLLKELGDWMSTAKTRAISLLMDVLVYCEEHITQEAHDIVPVLIKLYSSGDNVEAVNNAATLFGRFVQPEVYLPLLVPYVEGDVVLAGETSDLLSRAFALKLLARFLAAISKEEALLESMSLELKREHCRAAVALCHCLEGRGRASVGSSFDATGRLPNFQSTVNRLALLLLHLEQWWVSFGAAQEKDQKGESKESLYPGSADTSNAGVTEKEEEGKGNAEYLNISERVEFSQEVKEGLEALRKCMEEQPTVDAFVSSHVTSLLELVVKQYPFTALWSGAHPGHLALVALQNYMTESGAKVYTPAVLRMAREVLGAPMGKTKASALESLLELVHHSTRKSGAEALDLELHELLKAIAAEEASRSPTAQESEEKDQGEDLPCDLKAVHTPKVMLLLMQLAADALPAETRDETHSGESPVKLSHSRWWYQLLSRWCESYGSTELTLARKACLEALALSLDALASVQPLPPGAPAMLREAMATATARLNDSAVQVAVVAAECCQSCWRLFVTLQKEAAEECPDGFKSLFSELYATLCHPGNHKQLESTVVGVLQEITMFNPQAVAQHVDSHLKAATRKRKNKEYEWPEGSFPAPDFSALPEEEFDAISDVLNVLVGHADVLTTLQAQKNKA